MARANWFQIHKISHSIRVIGVWPEAVRVFVLKSLTVFFGTWPFDSAFESHISGGLESPLALRKGRESPWQGTWVGVGVSGAVRDVPSAVCRYRNACRSQCPLVMDALRKVLIVFQRGSGTSGPLP